MSGGDRSRKIRWCGIGLADGEVAFVSPAGPAKSLRIGNADVKSRTLIFAGELKVDADPVNAGRHRKRDFKVRLVLFALHIASEYQVCRRALAHLLSNRPGCKRESQKSEVHTPSLHEVQNNALSWKNCNWRDGISFCRSGDKSRLPHSAALRPPGLAVLLD